MAKKEREKEKEKEKGKGREVEMGKTLKAFVWRRKVTCLMRQGCRGGRRGLGTTVHDSHSLSLLTSWRYAREWERKERRRDGDRERERQRETERERERERRKREESLERVCIYVFCHLVLIRFLLFSLSESVFSFSRAFP